MKVIGMIATGLLAAAAGVAVVMGVQSRDDIKRYLRIRQM